MGFDYLCLPCKILGVGTKKLAQKLRLLSAHPKDPDSIPSTYLLAQRHHSPHFQTMPSSNLHDTPGAHMVFLHACRQNRPSHKIKELKKESGSLAFKMTEFQD